MSIAPGTRLGPYEVVAPLGAGGMGEVYRARDARLDREVAIKVLPAEVSADADRMRRFEKEARAASALNHPNIVTVHEIGREGLTDFLVMELISGRTLRDLLLSGPLPIKKVLAIGAQIAEGLARAHEAGIVHRDLKPENVMVTREGLVKILDFGLAKRTGTSPGSEEGSHLPTETGTSPGMILGTVGYMSPEQAAGEPTDFPSDQFSFGSILYEMATGKRAFQKGNAVDTLSAIRHEEPPPISGINISAPAPFRWIVEVCLAKDPQARYASTKDLARQIANIRDHLSEAGVSPAESTSRRFRVRGTVAFAVAALAVTVASAAGLIAGRTIWKTPLATTATARQVTFRRDALMDARFAPDGQVVYAEGISFQLFSSRPGVPERRSLHLPKANLMSISTTGDLAILMGGSRHMGTLATVPLGGGGAPRELLEGVRDADWAPDGKRLAVIHVVNGKPRLEFPIGKVLYQPAEFIFGGFISPRGDEIAFTEGGWVLGAVNEYDLKVVNLAGEVKTIGRTSYEYRWSPRGNEIWLNEIAEGTTTIRAVDLSGKKRFVASFPGDFSLCDVSRDGRVLLEAENQETEIIGGAFGDPSERNLSWLDGSSPADLSADGSTMLFTEIYHGGGITKAVYLRKTDGSPAVRLGDGQALALSPDGRWALSRLDGAPSRLTLLPTGAGQARTISLSSIQMRGRGRAFFLPDGKRILINGAEPGRLARLYIFDIDGGKSVAITPEGVPPGAYVALAPDGRSVVAPAANGDYFLYDAEGGAARPLPNLARASEVIRFSSDGRSLFIGKGDIRSYKVERMELSSGRSELWKEFSASMRDDGDIKVIPTADGKSYVYGYIRWASDLYVVEGLK